MDPDFHRDDGGLRRMKDKKFWVYILASKPQGTLYIGMTSDLKRRVWEHKDGSIEGFTKKYNIRRLVYFEDYEDFENAATRERQLKEWKRDWKKALIEQKNPHWGELII